MTPSGLQPGPDWLALEPQVRWYLYLFGFAFFIGWETFWPRRNLNSNTAFRWCGHAVIVVVATAVTIRFVPVNAIESSFRLDAAGWGLMPYLGFPLAARFILGLLAFDLVRYCQHWCAHRFALLWRVHRVHHSDPDLDLTTGLRFHPLDTILSIFPFVAVVWLLGVPPVAALVYELTHVVHAFFSHSNIRIPAGFESLLRKLIVTPETHRIHHSDDVRENLRNYGEMLTIWDRLFGTYQAQPALGQLGMGVGMKGYRGARTYNPLALLAWPFFDKAMGPPEPVDERIAEPADLAEVVGK